MFDWHWVKLTVKRSIGDHGALVRKGFESISVRLAGAFAGFLLAVKAGQLLGPAGAGRFFLCLGIISIFGAIARLGLDPRVTRLVAEADASSDPAKINQTYCAALCCTAGFSAIISPFVLYSSHWIARTAFDDPDLQPMLLWTAAALPFFSALWIHGACFQGLHRVKSFQLCQNTGWTFGLLLLVTVAQPTEELTWIKFFFFSTLVATLVAHVAWRRSLPSFFATFPSVIFTTAWYRNLVSYFGLTVLSQCTLWTPQLILGVFSDTGDVGILNAAFRIANLNSLFLVGVNGVLMPRIAALYANGEISQLRKLVRFSTRITFAACAPLTLVLLVFPGSIIAIFGEEFRSGAGTLQILALGHLVNIATGSVGVLLDMTGHQTLAFRASLASYLLTLSTMLVAVPYSGVAGAAAASSLGVCLTTLSHTYLCAAKLGVVPVNSLLPLKSQQ